MSLLKYWSLTWLWNRLIDFEWNSKLRTTIWRPPTKQDFISIRQRGWSRWIASLPLLWFLSLSFLVSSSRAQVAPVDRFWRSIRKIEKWPCLSNVLADCHDISDGDAFWLTWPSPPLKFPDFENPRWRRSPSWKIEKWRNLSNGLMDHSEIWHGDAVWPSWAFQPLKFQKIMNTIWRRPPYWKVENRHMSAALWAI